MKKILISFAIPLLIFSNLTFAKDVEYSLERAPVLLPYSGKRINFSEISLDKLTPAMIYLHGCGGINTYHDLYGWGEYIAKMGFLVILPDSFSRPNRIANCNSATKGFGTFPQAYEYRQQEIFYTLEQLKQIKNIDLNAIFLMGYSEGGVAAAQNSNKEFKGVIISSWTCAIRVSGLMTSKDAAVLAIAHTKDSWHDTFNLRGRCVDYARGRKVTQVDIKGYEHETFVEQEARDAVYKFLAENAPSYKLEEPKPIKIDLGDSEKDEPLIELSAPSK
jgi:dienelactone hydrolase